jgi:hypothetical protein
MAPERHPTPVAHRLEPIPPPPKGLGAPGSHFETWVLSHPSKRFESPQWRPRAVAGVCAAVLIRVPRAFGRPAAERFELLPCQYSSVNTIDSHVIMSYGRDCSLRNVRRGRPSPRCRPTFLIILSAFLPVAARNSASRPGAKSEKIPSFVFIFMQTPFSATALF